MRTASALPAVVAIGLAALVAGAVAGSPPGPAPVRPAPGEPPGKAVYDKYCGQCHGDTGDGRGIAAPYLLPPPRDFTSGKYKLRSTPSGSVPTDADLERSIRQGLPGTAMPAFTTLSDGEVEAVVGYVKSFSDAFEDPEAQGEPLDVPSPPRASDELAEQGREIFQGNCTTCHGELGRGDGGTAPLQRDQWYGDYIRVADLSMPWEFSAGGTREDVYRVLVTGLDGTPMASYQGALTDDQLWAIATWIASLSGNRVEATWAELVVAVPADGEIDPERGAEMFEAAPPALFPTVGQVMEPGRDFHPSVRAVEVRAVYDRRTIAFLVRWHDMRAETAGHNAPDMRVPAEEEEARIGGGGAAAAEPEGGAADDFWGAGTAAPQPGTAPAAEPAAEGGGGFWDQPAAGEGAGQGAAAAAGAVPESEFSDAVALQLPQTVPQGVVKPYFLFGDVQNPVELWYTDLASGEGQLWIGRGSDAVVPADGGEVPEVRASYDRGEWSVVFVRPRRPGTGLAFEDNAFVPIAVSVWDGFNRERGNRRALTSWYSVYLQPMDRPSPVGPALRAGAFALVAELLIIAWVRRRRRKRTAGLPAGD
jgi:mono/diheme cytochrome c family protein